MTTSNSIVQHQRPSCSKQTQAKAARLEVLDLTRRLALVQGDLGEYYVDMMNVICSCKAGRDGLRCSHCMAALIERSRMQGYGEVTFFDDCHDAKLACAALLKKGIKARLVEDNGYIFVEAETPPPVKVRRYCRYNPSTGLFDVMDGTTVVGHVSSYLEMERAS